MRQAVAVLLAISICPPAAAQELEFKLISSGANRPGIALWQSPLRDILAALHAGIDLRALGARLGLDAAGLAASVDSLKHEGAVVDGGGGLRPTCMVVTLDEGRALGAIAARVAHDALPFMRAAVGRMRRSYRDIRGLARLDFDDVSFFLASDVLLDNWQIHAVEDRWLHAARPLRGRARYYCAIFSNTSGDREAFGIYGNQTRGAGPVGLVGVYGNRRGRNKDLISARRATLATIAGVPDSGNWAELMGPVTDNLRRWAAAGSRAAAAPVPAAVDSLGLVSSRGRVVFAVFDTADQRRLAALAGSVSDPLIAHLERATPALREAWAASRWHDETTFEEYRIWWYHFFYSSLTDLLARDGLIRTPESGLFHYLLLP